MRLRTMRGMAAATATLAAAFAACAVAPCAQAAVGDAFSAESGMRGSEQMASGTAITYKVTAEPTESAAGKVQVGDGVNAAINASYAGGVVLPETVEHGGKTYKVVACGVSSFAFTKLTSVDIPDSVERINTQAFYSCSDLHQLSLGEDSQLVAISSKAFQLPQAQGGLSSISLPSRLDVIGTYAFSGQANATSLTFAAQSMTSIGSYAFEKCASLVSAEVPAITAEDSGYGALCFYGCSNLERFVYKGTIASVASADGTRTFEECGKLATVVYRGKKILPYYKLSGNPSKFSYREYYGFQFSDPKLYYTVTYYASKEEAQAGGTPLGSVCVRSDTRLCDITPQMAVNDSQGTVVWEGQALEVPEGFSAWAYEGAPLVTAAIEDSLYAYPVDGSDLSFASAELAENYLFTGAALQVNPPVYAANGKLLQEGVDYTLAYQRMGATGFWEDTTDVTTPGQLRLCAKGVGSYHGTGCFEFSIAMAAEGVCFEVDGITYCITKQADVGSPGEVSVGDGSSHAIDMATSGMLTIPLSVSPSGSSLSYAVTSVADFAFGGDDESVACAALSAVELPQTMTELGNSAFAHCTGLGAVTIPAGVSTLGARCFQGCTNIESLVFEGEKLESLGAYCFEQCASLTSVVLPPVTRTVSFAFANCVSLNTVELLGTLGSVDATQFSGCSRLFNILVPKAAYRVAGSGEEASASYASCRDTDSTTATVPAALNATGISYAVTAVGAKAFASSKAKIVTVKSKTVTSFKSAFKGSQVTKVKVPKAKLTAYKKLLTKAKCGKSVKVLSL